MRRISHPFRLRSLIAGLVLVPLALGGLDLHAATGASHQVASRGDRFVPADCDGSGARHLDSSRLQRQDPCAACARSLQQRGLDGPSPHSISAPEPGQAARSSYLRVPGRTDHTPARGRAPPLS